METDFRLYAVVDKPAADFGLVGGGIRVKKIDYVDPIASLTKTVAYTYYDGATPNLPSTFSDYDDTRKRVNRGLEFFTGNPGVLYGKVDVVMNTNIKSTYQFLTSHDLPVVIGTASVPVAENGSNRFSVTVTDPSMLWGSLVQVQDFRNTTEEIRNRTNSWTMNETQMSASAWTALRSNTKTSASLQPIPKLSGSSNTPYVRTNPTFAGKEGHFGVEQTLASHRYFHTPCTSEANGCPESNLATTQVVTQKFVPIPYQNEDKLDGLVSDQWTYFPDFLTGATLKTRKVNSENASLVTENIPAYSKYPFMETKNQLDQVYAANTYKYASADRSNFFQSEDPAKAISSSVSLWRPFDKNGAKSNSIPVVNTQAFRVFRTLNWMNGVGAGFIPLTLPDDGCPQNPIGGITYNVCNLIGESTTSPSNWQISNENASYDGFGHPIETRSNNGALQTTLYEYGYTLPSFYAQNAARNELLFESFESPVDARCKMPGWANAADCKNLSKPAPFSNHSFQNIPAKSGKSALQVTYNGGSNLVCFDLPNPTLGKTYEASAWFYDNQSVGTGANATVPGICIGNISGTSCSSPLVSSTFPGEATGSKQWKRVHSVFLLPSNWSGNISTLGFCLSAGGNGSTAPVLFDEVRFRPKGTLMSTFTFDNAGKIKSATDQNESTKFFEYDVFGNLRAIKNGEGKVLTEQGKLLGFIGQG